MKIGVAAIEKNEKSEISRQAGKAPYYLIFDEKGKLLKAISNPFSIGGGGAGFGVAKMLSDKNVNIVIAGKIGPNMMEALTSHGLKYYEKTGTAKDVVLKITK